MVSKLKGKALIWFHSRPKFIGMPMDNLLAELEAVFDHRQDSMTLRRKFESRVWKSSESFSDYFHEKLMLANAVPIAEEELLDYLIDGISDMSLRNQARIQQFQQKKGPGKGIREGLLEGRCEKYLGKRQEHRLKRFHFEKHGKIQRINYR